VVRGSARPDHRPSAKIGRVRRDLQEERARIQEIQEEISEQRARIQEEQDVEQSVKRTVDEQLERIDEREHARLANLAKYEREMTEASRVPFGFAGAIVTLRFAFEFILPPIVGAVSIAALLIRAF
jgi:hypothetical protein